MEQVTKSNQGQAVTEYVLLLSIVILLFATFVRFFEQGDAYEMITRPLTRDFKNAYQHGHPGSGSQKYIAQDPENFRIFLNPSTKR